MAYVTNFADQAVMLPLAAVVAAGLALAGWWRGLAAWLLSVGLTLGSILVMKVLGAAFAWHLGGPSVASPSGHVASATLIYGGLAVLLLRGVLPGAVLAMAPVAVAVVVGESRLALGAHSLPEVVIGAAIGLAGLAGLAVLAGPRPRMEAWPILAATACTMLAFHGLHMPAEQVIHSAFLVR